MKAESAAPTSPAAERAARPCALCGRPTSHYNIESVYTAYCAMDRSTAAPVEHQFACCLRCLNRWSLGHDGGALLFTIGWVGLVSWLIDWPRFLWRWDPKAPQGALSAQVLLAILAVGGVAWFVFHLRRRLEKLALASRPDPGEPGWSVGVIEAADARKSQGRALPHEPAAPVGAPQTCSLCGAMNPDPLARVVLQTGRLASARIVDVQSTATEIRTTSLLTYRDVLNHEAWLCPACWAEARGRLHRTFIYFTLAVPAVLFAALLGFALATKGALAGFACLALAVILPITWVAFGAKAVRARHPMVRLKQIVAAQRNAREQSAEFKILCNTWPAPRRRWWENF